MPERPSEVFFNVAVGIVGLALVAVLIRRELVPARSGRPDAVRENPSFVEDWQRRIPLHRTVGHGNGTVQLVEFVDYECGFCKAFEETTRNLLESYPSLVTVSYVHFPLRFHRFARLAANAAECALGVGRFREMHSLLLAKQDSLGLKPWSELAQDAGIADTAAFMRCQQDDATGRKVEAEVQLAADIAVSATPTLLVNGWKLPLPPSQRELEEIIKTLSAGRRWHPPRGDTIHIAQQTGASSKN